MPKAAGEDEDVNGQSSTSLKRQACLECRLNKTRCIPGSASSYPCLRCANNSFDCLTEVSRRRAGRKAKSKVAASAAVPPRLSSTQTPASSSSATGTKHTRIDAARCRRALVSILRSSAASSSTYTFVSEGEGAGVPSTGDDVHERQTNGAAESTSTTASLRSLLQPVTLDPASHRTPNISAEVLPSIIHTDRPRDPRVLGLVSRERAAVLLEYFYQHLSPWLAALDPELDVSANPFLYTVVLLQASRYINDRPTETGALATHARTMAVLTFAEGSTSQEVILAFYIFAIWKAPDETCCDLYTSYADRLAIMLGRSRTGRRWERIQFFHFVQQSVFLLHHSPSSANLLKRDDLKRKCQTWSLSPDSLVGDWFLCADVESTAIQCHYKSLFDEQQRQLPQLHASSSPSLLAAFHSQVEDWEQRWKAEAERRESMQQDLEGCKMRMAGLSLFRNSLCFQVSSIALCQALRHRGESTVQRNEDYFDYLTNTYKLCLDSALGILLAVLQLEEDAELLLHMPDSLVVLAAHATQLIVYLLVAPHAGASISSSTAAAPQTSQELYFDSILTRVSRESFSHCLDTMDRAQSLMGRAAALRQPLQTAVLLCSQYMASLIGLFRSVCMEPADLPPSASAPSLFDVDPTLSSGEPSLGWDWLETFLSQSVVQ